MDLDAILDPIAPLEDTEAFKTASIRKGKLTRPSGDLERLEKLAVD